MFIRVNGKEEQIDQPLSLKELVLRKGLQLDRIVIEHNGVILPRSSWGSVRLTEKDTLEIVSFVGGG
ncbi:MAG: bifunctional sulfur carrier protein/thiazole synthase protein [Candidatus Omnitrophica bacterium ADurb.Bin292]|nr:MAG: bifunctional sulfur carrier protein/thiazole synthase protein [Candidatus Omnitrophica bacterium ADurb.Bin292]